MRCKWQNYPKKALQFFVELPSVWIIIQNVSIYRCQLPRQRIRHILLHIWNKDPDYVVTLYLDPDYVVTLYQDPDYAVTLYKDADYVVKLYSNLNCSFVGKLHIIYLNMYS